MSESEDQPAPGMAPSPDKPATDVVHLGRDPLSWHGFVNTPVYRGSTVLFPNVETLNARAQAYTYGRSGTPTVHALEDAIRQIEGGEKTVLTSSGYQGVVLAILALVEAGDHILVVDSVYQPTRKFCDGLLAKLGVQTEYYDPLIGAGIARLIRPRTRLVFTESPGSQTFEIQDIPAIAAETARASVWLVMDNTWASPLLFKPFRHGVDISVQSATKYIVGHADAMLGAVTGNARAAPYLERGRHLVGVCPGSEETFLGARGLRTLAVRLKQHEASALEIARWLEARPEVATVIHPGLPSHPQHAIWARDFLGASGLFAIVLKPAPALAVSAMLDHLQLFGMGFSWGGYESLVIPFDPRPYRTATVWAHPGQALRLHIGLEDAGDLKRDLEAGFARWRSAGPGAPGG